MTLIIRRVVYLFYILFPLGLLIRVKIADNIFVTPLEIVIGVLFLILISKPKKLLKVIKNEIFLKIQAIFLLVGVVSLFINQFYYGDINILTSSLYVLRYVAALSLICVGYIYAKSVNIKKLVHFSGGTFVVFGFLQYIFFYDLRPYIHLGWDDHLYRLFSTFFDPNFAGLFYAVFAIYLTRNITDFKFNSTYFNIYAFFFSTIAVFASYSRSALSAFSAGLLSFMIMRKHFRYIMILIVGLLGFLLLFSDTGIEGLNPFRIASINNRIIASNEASYILSKSPFYGVGFNAYRDAQLRYGTRIEAGSIKSNADAGTDNSFLFAMVTTGFVGGALFIASYVLLLRKFLFEKGFSHSLFAMVVCLVFGSLFINALFYIPIMSWTFLLIGFRKQIG